MSHFHTNKLTKHYWTWPIAIYLFLGGLGGGMLFIGGLFDIIFGPQVPGVGVVLSMGVFAGVVCLGVGTLLLIFELGQPKVFVRVFLSGTAIIKYGAVLLTLAMLFAFVWFLFYLPPEWNLFWYSWTWLRDLCCPLMVVFGLGIMVYTGVLLSSMKSKPFWNTPALPVLFTTSALSTASAALAALAGLWPAGEHFISAEGAVLETEQVTEIFVEQLHTIDTILVMAEIVVLLVYVILMRAAGNVTARAMADSWLRGKSAPLFWGGMVVAGLLLPFLFYVTGGILATAIAPVLVLAAGLLLRFMVVYADVRRPIPGEERYWSRLPQGDEQFLKVWK